MRYLISKFRDFSRIFWNFSEFCRDFLDFENIYKNATLIFKVKIYRNAPPILMNGSDNVDISILKIHLHQNFENLI